MPLGMKSFSLIGLHCFMASTHQPLLTPPIKKLWKCINNNFVMTSTCTSSHKNKREITKKVKNTIIKCNKLYVRYKRNPIDENWENYRRFCNTVKTKLSQSKHNFVQENCNPQLSLQSQWKNLNKILYPSSTQWTVPDGSKITKPRDKTEAFNKFFISFAVHMMSQRFLTYL